MAIRPAARREGGTERGREGERERTLNKGFSLLDNVLDPTPHTHPKKDTPHA